MLHLATKGLIVTRNTITSRWMVILAGFYIMSVSGAIYAFGVYSPALKGALGYNQKTLNTIGFFKDFGNIGIMAGLIADLFPAWLVLCIGLAFNTTGYLMIWLSVTKRVAKPALWQMYLYITIGGNSIAFTHAGALVTCVKDFPSHRGMIVGLLKGFLGLSTAILTLFYTAIYGPNHPSDFILLIVYLPLVVILCFMFFIRPIKPALASDGGFQVEARFFYKLLTFELVTVGYLMVVILVQHTAGVSQDANHGLGAGLLLLLASPVVLVVVAELDRLRRRDRSQDLELTDSPSESTLTSPQKVKNDDDGDKALVTGELQAIPPPGRGRWLWTPPLGHDFTVWQALVHPDFWLLSAASTAGFGAGLMLIDNLGQVGASFGYNQQQTQTFVSLLSIWNCLGRIGAGFISEIFLQRSGIARPFFFAGSLALSAVGYLAIALALPGALFIGSILVGLCYGAQWSLLHIIVSEVFGLKYYGTLQSIIAMASPLGTFFLSVRVAGFLYDRQAERQHSSSCHGSVCYRLSFFIMCGATIFACGLTLVMSLRTMKFYKQDVYQKLKAAKLQATKEEVSTVIPPP